MAYYQTVDGVSCDKAIIDACEQAVAGRGDGRVSLEDAHTVFEKIKDGGKVTKAEVWTLRYCLTEYNFTEAASDWITSTVKSMTQWDAEKFAKESDSKSYYETVDGVECDHAVIEACRKAIAGQGDGRVSMEDAKAVYEQLADGGRITAKEKWTLRLCLSEFNWTESAHDWIIEEVKAFGSKKRPAAAPPKPAKKAKIVDETPAKIKAVMAAFPIAEKKGVSAEVIQLLSSMLEHCLPVYKEDRHKFQTEVLEVAGKTLKEAEAALQSDVAAASELVNNGDAEKAKRDAAVLAAESTCAAAQEDAKTKATIKSEKLEAHKATVAPLKAAMATQKEGDASAVTLEKDKASMEVVIAKELTPAKEAGANKKALASLSKGLGKAGLEDSLMEALHLPLSKKAEKRGIFDATVLASLDTALEQKLSAMAAELAVAGPAREERAAAVTAAQQAHDEAKAAHEEAAAALLAAKDAEGQGYSEEAKAKKSQFSLTKEIGNASKALENCQVALSEFQKTLSTFNELLERTAPPAEAEA